MHITHHLHFVRYSSAIDITHGKRTYIALENHHVSFADQLTKGLFQYVK